MEETVTKGQASEVRSPLDVLVAKVGPGGYIPHCGNDVSASTQVIMPELPTRGLATL